MASQVMRITLKAYEMCIRDRSIVKKQSVWAVVIDYIANSIQPVVPILIASGFLQSVLAMLNYLDIDTTTYTYQVLNSIGQAGYYFLPIFLAFAAAKKLRINPYLGALVGAVMVYPAIIEAGSAGGKMCIRDRLFTELLMCAGVRMKR